MKASKGTYILSIIDHKSEYDLGGVTIQIEKQYENNLRERNPQLGKVEGLPDDNWLSLEIGDTIAVNHFTFYGDIGKDKSFTLKDHFEIDEVKYFPAKANQMFFRYNDGIPEPFDEYVLCDYFEDEYEKFGLYLTRKGIRCTHGEYAGQEVYCLKHSMYAIELDKKVFYKVRKDEIVMVGEELRPGWNIVQPYPETFVDIIGWTPPNNHRAKCIKGDYEGQDIQVFRGQGVEYEDYRIIDEEMICFEL